MSAFTDLHKQHVPLEIVDDPLVAIVRPPFGRVIVLPPGHDDPEGERTADDLFHLRLTESCGNPELIAVLRPMREQLMSYERRYFSTQERRDRSAAQHGRIVDALEAGDHARAGELIRENFTTALPGPNAGPDGRVEG